MIKTASQRAESTQLWGAWLTIRERGYQVSLTFRFATDGRRIRPIRVNKKENDRYFTSQSMCIQQICSALKRTPVCFWTNSRGWKIPETNLWALNRPCHSPLFGSAVHQTQPIICSARSTDWKLSFSKILNPNQFDYAHAACVCWSSARFSTLKISVLYCPEQVIIPKEAIPGLTDWLQAQHYNLFSKQRLLSCA